MLVRFEPHTASLAEPRQCFSLEKIEQVILITNHHRCCKAAPPQLISTGLKLLYLHERDLQNTNNNKKKFQPKLHVHRANTFLPSQKKKVDFFFLF